MRRLVYLSRSRFGADSDAIDAIIDQSARLNSGAGITGMLWWDGANFAQVLEGPHDEIEQTMERIRKDSRHADVVIVSDRAVAGRLFGNWAMKRSDTSLQSTANTAFLVGLAANDRSPTARRLFEIMLACDG